jgi:hypothetical protein
MPKVTIVIQCETESELIEAVHRCRDELNAHGFSNKFNIETSYTVPVSPEDTTNEYSRYGIINRKSVKYNDNILLLGKYCKIVDEGLDFFDVITEDGGRGFLDINSIDIVDSVPKQIKANAFQWWN